VVGYCYGGGFCLKWASEADKVDAFVVAHTQIKVPDSLEKLEKPGLIICADRDFTQSEKVLLFQGFPGSTGIPSLANNSKPYEQFQALPIIPSLTNNSKPYQQFQALPTIPNSTSKAVERGVQMYFRLSVVITLRVIDPTWPTDPHMGHVCRRGSLHVCRLDSG
jgi:hypothetical protein